MPLLELLAYVTWLGGDANQAAFRNSLSGLVSFAHQVNAFRISPLSIPLLRMALRTRVRTVSPEPRRIIDCAEFSARARREAQTPAHRPPDSSTRRHQL